MGEASQTLMVEVNQRKGNELPEKFFSTSVPSVPQRVGVVLGLKA